MRELYQYTQPETDLVVLGCFFFKVDVICFMQYYIQKAAQKSKYLIFFFLNSFEELVVDLVQNKRKYRILSDGVW